MGYRVVTVNQLTKPFPLPSFGLANTKSLEDAKKQLQKKHESKKNDMPVETVTTAEKILKDIENKGVAGKLAAVSGLLASVKNPHDNFFTEALLLEVRWPVIEPALKAHLARQERRLAHFNASCRVTGCGNPHRQMKGGAAVRATKAHRPAARPLFCGLHAGTRQLLTKEQIDSLLARSSNRVAIA